MACLDRKDIVIYYMIEKISNALFARETQEYHVCKEMFLRNLNNMGILNNPMPTRSLIIGRGGSSIVYKSRNDLDGCFYAVKKIGFKGIKLPERVSEVRILARCNSPYVIRYYGNWIENRGDFDLARMCFKSCKSVNRLIANDSSLSTVSSDKEYDESDYATFLCVQMELCDAALSDEIESGRLTVREKIKRCLEIARGVQYIHGKKIIHGDIKPSNILIGAEDGIAKLSDFGSSVDMNSGESGVFRGTMGYIPPESILHPADCISFQADRYSLGKTLFHLCSDQTTYMGRSVQFKRLHEEGEVVIDDRITNIIKRLTSPNESKRMVDFDTVLSELGTSLENLEEGKGVVVLGCKPLVVDGAGEGKP